MLSDPVGNEFQVIVRKFDGKAYFTTGWREMGHYYSLYGGGIIRLVYVRSNLFFIKVKDRFGDEVQYPTPPKIFRLAHEPVPNDSFDFLLGERYLRELARVPILCHAIYKTLTRADVVTGKLVCASSFVIYFFYLYFVFTLFSFGIVPLLMY